MQSPIECIKDWLIHYSKYLKDDKSMLLVNKGYLLLERPRFRKGTVQHFKHCFAEFVAGMVKLVSLSEINELSELIWKCRSTDRWVLMQTERGTESEARK
jgi:hypothetical protein